MPRPRPWFERLGLTVTRTDAAPAPSSIDGSQRAPSHTPRWLDRITPSAPDDGEATEGRIRGMTDAERREATDWLNHPRGWRRLR